MKFSVAIDGPAGAGKSTIAKLVAKEFDLMYINTGAMYRTVALKASQQGITPEDTDKLSVLIDGMDMKFVNDDLYLNGENIQEQLVGTNITSIVSGYASVRKVREMLVKLQRDMSNKYNVIMDGRDIGTVVLKDAKYKFFLTATADERATRRFKELQSKGMEVDYKEILADIERRDYLDSTREIDPLVKADDAIEIDTTGLNIVEVTQSICNKIK